MDDYDEYLRAIELLHDALDADDVGFHSRDGGIIDSTSGEIVRALLKAGWKPPEEKSPA